MTPAQILATIRNQVYETTAAFYTDAEIYSYMWQAEQDLAEITKSTEAKDTSVTSSTGTQLYNVPSTVAYIHRVEWDGVKLKKIDLTEEDALDFNQYGSTKQQGSPNFYFQWGNQIGLYPVPNDAKNVTMYYYAEPSVITSASTAFTLPSILHRYIPDYALYRMYAKDQDEGRAQFHRQQWEANLIRAKQLWSKRMNEDKYWVVRDTENYAQTELGII